MDYLLTRMELWEEIDIDTMQDDDDDVDMPDVILGQAYDDGLDF